MKKRNQLDPDALAVKYIAQLEADLRLERERIRIYRADVEFYRGKCEKLELAVLEGASTTPAESFVRRSEPKRPSIGQTRIEAALRPKFQELRQKWDKLDAATQEKIMETGEWKVDEEIPVTK